MFIVFLGDSIFIVDSSPRQACVFILGPREYINIIYWSGKGASENLFILIRKILLNLMI